MSGWLDLPGGGGGGGDLSDIEAGSAFIGTPSTSGFIVKAGTSVVSLSSNEAVITFPTPFPSGVLTVIAINGDTNAVTSALVGVETITLTNFRVRAAISSGGYRVNWLAIGW